MIAKIGRSSETESCETTQWQFLVPRLKRSIDSSDSWVKLESSVKNISFPICLVEKPKPLWAAKRPWRVGWGESNGNDVRGTKGCWVKHRPQWSNLCICYSLYKCRRFSLYCKSILTLIKFRKKIHHIYNIKLVWFNLTWNILPMCLFGIVDIYLFSTYLMIIKEIEPRIKLKRLIFYNRGNIMLTKIHSACVY